jgi:hypothetical protein
LFCFGCVLQDELVVLYKEHPEMEPTDLDLHNGGEDEHASKRFREDAGDQ